LLLALLRRPFAGGGGQAMGTLTRTERTLADLIRVSLAQAGLTAPDLCDNALIAWFNRARP
jgi:hypothetical protein